MSEIGPFFALNFAQRLLKIFPHLLLALGIFPSLLTSTCSVQRASGRDCLAHLPWPLTSGTSQCGADQRAEQSEVNKCITSCTRRLQTLQMVGLIQPPLSPCQVALSSHRAFWVSGWCPCSISSPLPDEGSFRPLAVTGRGFCPHPRGCSHTYPMT